MSELRWNDAMAQAYARKTDTERECRIAISDAIIHYIYDLRTPQPSRHPLMSVARYLNNQCIPAWRAGSA